MIPATLVFGFYGEGARDYNFLMPLVSRSLKSLIPDRDVRAISFRDVPVKGIPQIEKMLRVAEAGYGSCQFIIFHLDADAPDTRRAYAERFQPGYNAILNAPGTTRLNQRLVPVIPVRMTEAWMLADFAAFQKATAARLSAKEINFPVKSHQVESIPDPKNIFETAVNTVNRQKRRNISLNALCERLASLIDLDSLQYIPAYREFIEQLQPMLRS